jgi:hypothetical protein
VIRRLLALPLLVALTAPALAPAAVGTAAACASAGGPHAALVIDTGARELELCVELSRASVSGLELIRLAAQQYGLEYALGFAGQAVCRLAGVGPSGGDCFADYPDYWGFWRGGPGGWTWSGTGAGSSSVGDGGLQGWSWGSGDSGATHPPPPAVTFEEVCPPAPRASPSPADGDGGGHGGGGDRSAPSGSAATSASPPSTRSRSSAPRTHSRGTPAPAVSREASPLDDTSVIAAGNDGPGDGAGPPIGSIAAVGAVIALALGGAAVARRRGKREA